MAQWIHTKPDTWRIEEVYLGAHFMEEIVKNKRGGMVGRGYRGRWEYHQNDGRPAQRGVRMLYETLTEAKQNLAVELQRMKDNWVEELAGQNRLASYLTSDEIATLRKAIRARAQEA